MISVIIIRTEFNWQCVINHIPWREDDYSTEDRLKVERH
jgi:hypothetical protein